MAPDYRGHIIIRTPHQQARITLTTDMDTSTMLTPLCNAFHPDRGIGQWDTPSALIFIAVFDILLTLMDDSGTG